MQSLGRWRGLQNNSVASPEKVMISRKGEEIIFFFSLWRQQLYWEANNKCMLSNFVFSRENLIGIVERRGRY